MLISDQFKPFKRLRNMLRAVIGQRCNNSVGNKWCFLTLAQLLRRTTILGVDRSAYRENTAVGFL